MKNDYLWDGTGEPDAKVQELEALLGELRSHPRPLALDERPLHSAVGHAVQTATLRFPALRVATIAAVALLALAAALWAGLRSRNAHSPVETAGRQPSSERPAPSVMPLDALPSTERAATQQDEAVRFTPQRKPARRTRPLRTATPHVREFPSNRDFSEAAVAEGERAKEQLLLALHLAGAKLNAVQRKIQQHGEPQS